MLEDGITEGGGAITKGEKTMKGKRAAVKGI